MKQTRPKDRHLTPRASERRDKDVGIEKDKAALRMEEAEAAAAACAECTAERARGGDPTAFCAEHLRFVYGA